jgi:hypothetical protein
MAVKKLTLAFLGIPLTLFALTSQARTYSVSFFNPTGSTMTEKVTPNNTATHIECSGYCTTLPPNGTVIYKISSNESTFPWGPFTATFTYSKGSNYCDSAVEGMAFKYEITNYSLPTNFFINVGAAMPDELYGNITTNKKCAE